MYGSPMVPAYGAPMYAPPPPMYAPPSPMYAPPPPAPAAGPTVITVGDNNNNGGEGSPCPTCCKDTGNIARKKIGMVAILWCVCLFFFTGSILSCYPFCTDGCKDTELVCIRCQTVKTKIPANCC